MLFHLQFAYAEVHQAVLILRAFEGVWRNFKISVVSAFREFFLEIALDIRVCFFKIIQVIDDGLGKKSGSAAQNEILRAFGQEETTRFVKKRQIRLPIKVKEADD